MKAREIDAGRRQRRCIRPVGWRDPHHITSGRLHACQCGQRETDFADALAFQQQFGQCALRPAVSGQYGIERGKPRWHGRGLGRAIVTAPDRGMGEQCDKRGGGMGHRNDNAARFRGPAL